MPQSDKTKEFIEKVCGEIKAKNARGAISNELIAHIEDLKAAYIKNGMNENIAEERAVEEMGDPVTVGENLNKVHSFSPYNRIETVINIIMWIITGCIALCSAAFGIGIIWSMLSIHPEDVFAAVIVGFHIIILGNLGAFTFISIYKLISNLLFYHDLFLDYKRRKKRGEYKLWNLK